MSIGDNIKKYRKLNRLTQKELGEKIGKNERTIRGYEADDTIPPLAVIRKMAEVFNVEDTDLIVLNQNNIEPVLRDALTELVMRTKEETVKIIDNTTPQWTKIGFENKFNTPFEFWQDVVEHYPYKFCNLLNLFNDKDFDSAIDEIAKFLEVAFDTKVKEIINRKKNKHGQ